MQLAQTMAGLKKIFFVQFLIDLNLIIKIANLFCTSRP